MSSPPSSPITSRPPKAEFTSRFVQPPSSLYVFRDDRLFLRIQSSRNPPIDVLLRGRLLTPDGEIITLDFTLASLINREPVEIAFELPEGYLLGLVGLSSTTNITRGEVWITVGITRGGDTPGTITQLLFTGYLEGMKSPSWPVSGIESPVSGQGRIFSPTFAAPGAGEEWAVNVPSFVRWRLQTLTYSLTTNATVASRRLDVEVVTILGNRILLTRAGEFQTASRTDIYTIGHWGHQQGGLNITSFIPWPPNLLLGRGDIIRSITTNMQSTDLYSIQTARIEEWIEEF